MANKPNLIHPPTQASHTSQGINVTENTNEKVKPFSKVVSYSLFPKKEQAIIIDTIDGVEVKTYLKAIATKTLPTNIVASSKIAQNRFCCYLNSASLVDVLTKEGNNKLVIGNQSVFMRPYVSKSKRVIFSNVHPCIPHDELLNVIQQRGINPKSSMSTIRLGFDEPGFQHIMSFRRQLYIDSDDIDKLPKEFTINYEETLYHIYISTDKIACFVCKQEGHTAKYCKADASSLSPWTLTQSKENAGTADYPSEQGIDSHSKLSNTTQEKEADKTLTDTKENNVTAEKLEFNGMPLFKKPVGLQNINTPKRVLSSSTSTQSSEAADAKTDSKSPSDKRKEPKKKKIKKGASLSAELEAQIQTAKINISNETSATFPIDFENLLEFLTRAYTTKYKEVKSLADEYTNNNQALAVMLQETYKHISLTEVKGRITKIIRHLLAEDMELDDTSSNNDGSLADEEERNLQ